MSKTILCHLVRLCAASALVVAFAVVSGPAVPPESLLSTQASAVNGIRSVDDVCFWEELDWDEMQPAEQKAWRKLGWTEAMWDSDSDSDYPVSEDKDWIEPNDFERRALMDLGYTGEIWDEFDADDC